MGQAERILMERAVRKVEEMNRHRSCEVGVGKRDDLLQGDRPEKTGFREFEVEGENLVERLGLLEGRIPLCSSRFLHHLSETHPRRSLRLLRHGSCAEELLRVVLEFESDVEAVLEERAEVEWRSRFSVGNPIAEYTDLVAGSGNTEA